MTADPERLRRILEEEGVTTTDPQSLGEVVGVAADRFTEAVFGGFEGFGVGELPPWVVGGLLVVLGLLGLFALGLAGVLLVRFVRRARVPARPERPPPRSGEVGADPWGEVEAALTAGDAARALRALWVGIGRGLATQGVTRFGRETTVREVLRSTRLAGFGRQEELDRLGRSIERHLFAGGAPSVEAVAAMLPAARRVSGGSGD